jgi:hypothetical protein
MAILNLEINKELVLSTCHVKESTLCGSFNEEFVKGHDYSGDDCNVRLNVECCLDWNERNCATQLGAYFPEELLNLLQIAELNECKWLVLDCDGGVVQGLPTFDW